jgi:hypothetical protein
MAVAMSAPASPSSGSTDAILVPRLDLSVGAPDPVAIATWHMALSNLVASDIPHQLLGLWVFPDGGGSVLLGPEALDRDHLEVPEPDPFLSQDRLFELEERLRAARYASAVALPVHGADRDVGLALIGAFDAGAWGPTQVRHMQELAARLTGTLEPLSRLIRGRPPGGDTAIAPVVAGDQLLEALARTVAEAPSGTELVRRLSGLLHAHLPHDRLELVAFANGSGAAMPLGGGGGRRRWAAGTHTWGDLVRLAGDLLGPEPAGSVPDLAAEAPGLSWPGVPGAGPSRVASVLAARLELGGARVGMLLLGHAAADVYRPADEELALLVARVASGRVAAFRHEAEAQALRGQLEVLQAPTLPVLRAAEALAGTAHLGEALHRVAAEVREVLPHEHLRILLRWSDHEVVTLTADTIRPLADLPLLAVDTLAAAPVLDGDEPWVLADAAGGVELAVPLRVADRRIGALVLGAPAFPTPREAAATAQQFAAVVAPHLELFRRAATAGAVRPPRPAAGSVPRPGG